MNKSFCRFPFNGFQVTSRGLRLCCLSGNLHQTTPETFWSGEYLQDVRKNMESGTMLKDCVKCYHAEEQNSLSLRNHYNSIISTTADNDYPTVIDLDLSNFCNLKCVMCNENRSSQWAKENNPNVPNNGVKSIDIKQIDNLCKISKNLTNITIQGGEPSIIPEYNYYFDYLIDAGLCENIEIDCISNLTNINNKFFSQLKKFSKVNINVSLDAFGTNNDYIRFPSNFEQIEKNIKHFVDSKMQINLQISLQTLSMFNFYDFLKWIHRINLLFQKHNKKLGVHLSRVFSPIIFNIAYAPLSLKKHFVTDVKKFLEEFSPKFDLKFNLEIQRLIKHIFDEEKELVNELKNFVIKNDTVRSINIKDYISNFEEHF